MGALWMDLQISKETEFKFKFSNALMQSNLQ